MMEQGRLFQVMRAFSSQSRDTTQIEQLDAHRNVVTCAVRRTQPAKIMPEGQTRKMNFTILSCTYIKHTTANTIEKRARVGEWIAYLVGDSTSLSSAFGTEVGLASLLVARLAMTWQN
jgi:hypothetical protein